MQRNNVRPRVAAPAIELRKVTGRT
jgi:hypothetical protein